MQYALPVDYNNLTPSQRRQVRLQYIQEQDNKCYHCKGNLDAPSLSSESVTEALFPTEFFCHPIHLHHCHKTGKTFGAVHTHCNAVLWGYHGE